MSCYISSNNNRAYVALESSYGGAATVAADQRIPLVHLTAKQSPVTTDRRDKTGSRTFAGLPNRIRKTTTFQLNTFMTQWGGAGQAVPQGPLFQGAMGAAPASFSGGTVSSVTGQTQITFTAAHGLAVGQGITVGGEIRFVEALVDSTTVVVNAPFSVTPGNGTSVGATVTYALATDLPSVTIYDFWDPATAVQRLLNGAAMDQMSITVNGDFHEFQFAGPAQDVIDSASFTAGEAGLASYPSEPVSVGFDQTIVPGHIGQVWMGSTPNRFYSLTEAQLKLNNQIAQRAQEFGSDVAQCIAGGQRSVQLDFKIFEQDDAQTKELYQAARSRSPIGAMIQLGEQSGQLLGAYMPAMVPEVPVFDDQGSRLQWSFSGSRAEGSVDDELYIAFG